MEFRFRRGRINIALQFLQRFTFSDRPAAGAFSGPDRDHADPRGGIFQSAGAPDICLLMGPIHEWLRSYIENMSVGNGSSYRAKGTG